MLIGGVHCRARAHTHARTHARTHTHTHAHTRARTHYVQHLNAVRGTFDGDDDDDGGSAEDKMDRLQVPRLEKQWLVSPPPSPPEGWVPRVEEPPIFNADLVEALLGLDPTVERELHPAR